MALAALVAYTLWPQHAVDDLVAVLPAGTVGDLTLNRDGLEMAVAGTSVLLRQGGVSVARTLDDQAKGKLAGVLGQLKAPRDKVVEGVGEGQLAAYGIGMGCELRTGPVLLRWAVRDGLGYVHDAASRRLWALPAAAVQALDAAAARLDVKTLVANSDQLRRLEVDGLVLAAAGGGWIYPFQRHRPGCTNRVRRLLTLIGGLKLEALDLRVPPLAPTIAALRLGESPVPQTLAIHPDGDGALVALGDLPPQRIDAAGLAAWKAALADLGRDYLLDLAAYEPWKVVVRRDDAEWFRLERQGIEDDWEGNSQWDLVWPGGRETARAAAGKDLAALFAGIAVEGVHPLAAGEQPPATAVAAEFWTRERRDFTVAVAGDRLWANGFTGRMLHRPAALERLSPDGMLDLALCRRMPDRALKLQRQLHDQQPPLAEVVAREERGAWRRSWPRGGAGPVDQLACMRLARAVCQAHGHSARLATAEDRSVLAAPDVEVDLRFAPRRGAKAANDDFVDLEDTAPFDMGLAFRRQADGGWRAVDKERGVSWLVDDQLVEEIRLPLVDGVVFPVIPSLVKAVEIGGSQGRMRLQPDGAGWQIRAGAEDQPWRPALSVEVRRFFRVLTTLQAKRRDEKGGALLPNEVVAYVHCELPAPRYYDAERLSLLIGRPERGEVPVSASTTREGAEGPKGRMWIDAALIEQLTPAASRFIDPERDAVSSARPPMPPEGMGPSATAPPPAPPAAQPAGVAGAQ